MAKQDKNKRLRGRGLLARSRHKSHAPQKSGGTSPRGYAAFLFDLKSRVRSAQIKAAVRVNRELIELYWGIGRDITRRQKQHGWGNAVVKRLAMDLQREFPDVGGFSPGNVWRMRSFYLAYAEMQSDSTENDSPEPGQTKLAQHARVLREVDLPQDVAEIPWGHNILLIEKLKQPERRLWYAQHTLVNGWSRNMLAHWIELELDKRQGRAINNFPRTLPTAQSDLAVQTLKDPYVFDFLNIAEDAQERELEGELLSHITRFLLELGAGFAFVGRQFRMEVEGDEYALDLLFYHVRLHCFVVIDLKTGPFKPEYAGKMNFYLSAVDDMVRGERDEASIGLILCREKKGVTVEYALRDMRRPIGVAGWRTQLTDSLPKGLQGSLPTTAQFESEFRQVETRVKRRRLK